MSGTALLDSSGAPNLTIGLLWHTFGHGNLGVDALSRANLHLVRQAAVAAGWEPRFIAIGSGQRETPPDLPAGLEIGASPDMNALARRDTAMLSDLRRCDIVIDIGEGDSFTDIYGGRRFVKFLVSKMLAIGISKRLVLAPQTIGPFQNPVRRWLAVRVMNRAEAVFARDQLSTAFLRQGGVTTQTAEFIDVAFALPFTQTPKTPGTTKVGLNISGLLYAGGYSGKNEFGLTIDYTALSNQLIEYFTAMTNTEVHLIPHVMGSGPDDDYAQAEALKQVYPQLILPSRFASAEQAKSYISGMDFVVGGRMHACIGAFSARVPVVPIAYSRKFNGLFATLGYRHLVDGKVDNTETALSKIKSAFADRTTLLTDVETGLTIANARLKAYVAALTAILAENKKAPPS